MSRTRRQRPKLRRRLRRWKWIRTPESRMTPLLRPPSRRLRPLQFHPPSRRAMPKRKDRSCHRLRHPAAIKRNPSRIVWNADGRPTWPRRAGYSTASKWMFIFRGGKTHLCGLNVVSCESTVVVWCGYTITTASPHFSRDCKSLRIEIRSLILLSWYFILNSIITSDRMLLPLSEAQGVQEAQPTGIILHHSTSSVVGYRFLRVYIFTVCHALSL